MQALDASSCCMAEAGSRRTPSSLASFRRGTVDRRDGSLAASMGLLDMVAVLCATGPLMALQLPKKEEAIGTMTWVAANGKTQLGNNMKTSREARCISISASEAPPLLASQWACVFATQSAKILSSKLNNFCRSSSGAALWDLHYGLSWVKSRWFCSCWKALGCVLLQRKSQMLQPTKGGVTLASCIGDPMNQSSQACSLRRRSGSGQRVSVQTTMNFRTKHSLVSDVHAFQALFARLYQLMTISRKIAWSKPLTVPLVDMRVALDHSTRNVHRRLSVLKRVGRSDADARGGADQACSDGDGDGDESPSVDPVEGEDEPT